MKNHITISLQFLYRALLVLVLIGLFTAHVNSQTTTSQTPEKTVPVNRNEDNDFTFTIAPTPPRPGCPGSAAVPCLDDQINSLWLPIPLRFARLFQYEYKLTETPGTVQVGTEFLPNPQDNLHQHTITWKFAELFPDRLSMFKRGSEYLKKNPDAAGTGISAGVGDQELARVICDDDPLITCMTKGGNWFKRAWMGTTISATLGQRSLVQQQILVEPTFKTKYQFAGGFTFDPAKIFPSVSSYRAMLDEVQRVDKGIALIGARDIWEEGKRPWENRWSVIFPKVDFKILTQFDFVKFGGALVEAPFPERALNTWTFTWDLTRLIPDTKNRIDEDAIHETLAVLRDSLGKVEWKKRCNVQMTGEVTRRFIKDVHPAFSAVSCQELARIMTAPTYQLSCTKEGSPDDDGPMISTALAPVLPPINSCKW